MYIIYSVVLGLSNKIFVCHVVVRLLQRGIPQRDVENALMITHKSMLLNYLFILHFLRGFNNEPIAKILLLSLFFSCVTQKT